MNHETSGKKHVIWLKNRHMSASLWLCWAWFLVFMGVWTLPSISGAAKNNPFKFSHTVVKTAGVNQPLKIRCKAEENDDLDEVFLFYRVAGSKAFKKRRMRLREGIIYTVVIPAKEIRGKALEYYIAGRDANKKVVGLFASAAKPQRVSLEVIKKGAGSRFDANKSDDTSGDDDGDEDDGGGDTVYSASRREQRIQMAPSVVTVVTAADIKSYGWRTLIEILRHVVGIDINYNGHWADIGVRGVNPRVTYGDKMLFLVDGHNMAWRQFNRNYISPSWVSIDNIKRIEIIRGPGSSLWGANAISGVVNIITKTAQDLKGFQTIGGGSPLSQSYFLSVLGGQNMGNGVIFRSSFSLHRQNRTPILSPILEFLRLSDSDYTKLNQLDPSKKYKRYSYQPAGDNYLAQNFYARLSWKGLSLSFMQGRYDPHAPMSTFSQLGGDDSRFVTDRYITKISYATPLSSWGTIFLWSSFDYHDFAPETVYEKNPFSTKDRSLVPMAARDMRLDVGAQFSAQLYLSNPFQLSLISGLDYEFLHILRWHFPTVWEENSLPLPEFLNHHFGAFVQLQASIVQTVHITAGGRFDYDSVYGAVFTPRVAIVFTPGGGFYSKLLYGNAFKAPSYHDLYYFRKNAFYGNANLKPESVHTAEIQLGWHKNKMLSVSVNGYLSSFSNLIGYKQKEKTDPIEGKDNFPSSQLPDGSSAYKQKANISELSAYGGELELRIYAVKGLNILGRFGLFLGHNGPLDKPGSDLLYSARWQGQLSASYRFRAGSIGMSLAFGILLTGPKKVPAKAYHPSDAVFPGVKDGGKPVGVPKWAADQKDADAKGLPVDPTTETPIGVRTFVMVQFLDIFKHMDLAIRASNLLNYDNYDANDLLFYPQEKFDLMLLMRVTF